MASFTTSEYPMNFILPRMTWLQVKLDAYIKKVTWAWTKPPVGFDFICSDCAGLGMALLDSGNFGCDSPLGSSKHKGASFREVSPTSSIHIVTYASNPGEKGDNCSVHLDTVSPVKSRDEKTKFLVYDYGKVLQHVVTDFKHYNRIIVPSSENGFVFGIKF